MNFVRLVLVIIVALFSCNILANDVEIVNVEFIHKSGTNWRVNTTLKHADSGWDHYADAWRVMSKDGKKLGERILFHPHETEQPFTRSLSQLTIPQSEKIVYLEAHDKVHGWSKQRVMVDLSQLKGNRYRVRH